MYDRLLHHMYKSKEKESVRIVYGEIAFHGSGNQRCWVELLFGRLSTKPRSIELLSKSAYDYLP